MLLKNSTKSWPQGQNGDYTASETSFKLTSGEIGVSPSKRLGGVAVFMVRQAEITLRREARNRVYGFFIGATT